MKNGGYRFMVGRMAGILLFAAACAGALTEEEMRRVFDEHGIGYDEASLQEGRLRGMLESVDPRARIVRAGEAASIDAFPPAETNELLNGAIRYVRIHGLAGGSGDAMARMTLEPRMPERIGLVLDLRGAGGNDLTSVDRIAGLFVPAGSSLYSVRDGGGQVVGCGAVTNGGAERLAAPVMVLVDGETSGASEVLAGVLQGTGGALVIGGRTRGHAGLMQLVPLSDSEFLHIATRWVTLENNAESMDEGVLPDIVVEARTHAGAVLPAPGKELEGKTLSAKAKLDRDLMERVANDAALGRAIDILLGLNALRSAAAPVSLSADQGTPANRE